MEREPGDAKRQEIVEAAQRYAAHHWRSALPELLLCVLVGAWNVLVFVVWAPRTAGLVWFAGTVTVLVLWGLLFGRRPLGSPPVTPVAKPEVSHGCLRALLLLALLIAMWHALYWLAGPLLESSARLEALLLGGGLAVASALQYRFFPAPDGGGLRRQPATLAALAVTIAYGAAVALGLPEPGADLDAPRGSGLRVLSVLLVYLISEFLFGILYSRLQFRRLQRLVNDVPQADSHGTH